MAKSEIFNYEYKYSLTGYEITYKGETIAGQSINLSLLKKRNSNYIEFHRQEAQKLLLEILKQKNLWRTKEQLLSKK